MDILIVGPSGSGKSKLGDLVRNTIFKLDKEAKILTRDPDRGAEPFGEGKNTYNVEVRQIPLEELNTLFPDELRSNVIIILTGDSVGRWFKDVYES